MRAGKLLYSEPFGDYLARPESHFSALRHLAMSPKHYQHALANDRGDTTALRVGRAVHALSLMGDLAAMSDVAIFAGKVRRGKEWAAFEAANEGRLILRDGELAKARAMHAAIKRDPIAHGLIATGKGAEVTCTWERVGIPLRCRFDLLVPFGFVEMKTTRTIHPRAFSGEVARRHYHVQLALYADGYTQATGRRPSVRMIAIQNEAPYDVAVYQVGEDVLSIGLAEADRWLSALRDCQRTGSWPGVTEGEMQVLELPSWLTPDAAPELELDGEAVA